MENLKELSFDKKISLYKNLKLKYNNLTPIIINVHSNCKLLLKQELFLVSETFTVNNFLKLLRKQTNILYSKTIFIFNKDKILLSTDELINIVYEKYKNNDGFLYLTISTKNSINIINTFSILDTILNSSKKIVKNIRYYTSL